MKNKVKQVSYKGRTFKVIDSGMLLGVYSYCVKFPIGCKWVDASECTVLK
jgi:hypothetical protein